MEKYSVNKFGLFRCIDTRTNIPEQHLRWICIIAAQPVRTDIKHYMFEAEDDIDAKLIYEIEYADL